MCKSLHGEILHVICIRPQGIDHDGGQPDDDKGGEDEDEQRQQHDESQRAEHEADDERRARPAVVAPTTALSCPSATVVPATTGARPCFCQRRVGPRTEDRVVVGDALLDRVLLPLGRARAVADDQRLKGEARELVHPAGVHLERVVARSVRVMNAAVDPDLRAEERAEPLGVFDQFVRRVRKFVDRQRDQRGERAEAGGAGGPGGADMNRDPRIDPAKRVANEDYFKALRDVKQINGPTKQTEKAIARTRFDN